jgi:glycosyltransferase involved in cell wall biosynthesis
MKKVAFFTPSLNIGGVERVFITYANCLVDKFEVDYVICHENGDLKQYLNEKVSCVPLHTQLRYSLIKLSEYIKKYRPEYLITGGEISNTIALFANKISGSKTKVIFSQHNYFNIEQSCLSRFIFKFIYRYIYPKAYKIIAVSSGIADFIENFNIPKNKIVTIYNPVNIQSIYKMSQSSDNSFNYSDYILFVGRLSEVKNLHFLIRSFSLLKKSKPELNLVLVGDGPMKNSLEDLVFALHLNNCVSFVGIVSNPYFLIQNALLIVLPSYSEALPTIILESFTLGKTIVATPTHGALDLLKNNTYGYISNSFNDEVEYSDLMLHALSLTMDPLKLTNYAAKFDIAEQNLILLKKPVKL